MLLRAAARNQAVLTTLVRTFFRTLVWTLVGGGSLTLATNAAAQPPNAAAAADVPVFSGPQVGEPLVPFTARGVYGDQAGTEFNLVEQAAEKPVLLIFVHEVTRPSAGVTRVLGNYAATRHKDGLHTAVVFLTADATETENWLQRARRALPTDVPLGISPDGLEGPGSYGLNRHVALTVLVAKDKRVTANFALVQPSLQADVPRILQAIVDVVGGEVPKLSELEREAMARDAGPDEQLVRMVRRLAAQDLSAEKAAELAREIEQYVGERAPRREQLRALSQRFLASDAAGQMSPEAKETLQRWSVPAKTEDQVDDTDLRALLQPLIRKTASAEDVQAAAAKAEAAMKDSPALRARVGRAAQTVVRSGKLENYGTPEAQAVLRDWAKRYGPADEAPRRDDN